MRHTIKLERQEGLEMYRLRIFDYEGICVYDTTRWSEQGARIALMTFAYRAQRGVTK